VTSQTLPSFDPRPHVFGQSILDEATKLDGKANLRKQRAKVIGPSFSLDTDCGPNGESTRPEQCEAEAFIWSFELELRVAARSADIDQRTQAYRV
jgi:hypothetical protein